MSAESKKQAERWLHRADVGLAYRDGVDDLALLLDNIKYETVTRIYLPKITDEILEQYDGTELLDWEDDRPGWTQTAVDFACMLKSNCINREE